MPEKNTNKFTKSKNAEKGLFQSGIFVYVDTPDDKSSELDLNRSEGAETTSSFDAIRHSISVQIRKWLGLKPDERQIQNAIQRMQDEKGWSKEAAELAIRNELKLIKQEESLEEAEREKIRLTIENEELYQQARTDHLTRIPNKRAYTETIEREIGHAERDNPLSAIMIDIDHFKTFNDDFGHDIGDKILIKVAQILENNLYRKKIDMVARYGGEEFVVILPGTDSKAAKNVAERLRGAVEEGTKDMKPRGVTISAGFATFDKEDEELNTSNGLKIAADKALYHSKKEGRNCVAQFEKGMEMPPQDKKLEEDIESLEIEYEQIQKEFTIKKRSYIRLKDISPKNKEKGNELMEELELIDKEMKAIDFRMNNLLIEISEKKEALKELRKAA